MKNLKQLILALLLCGMSGMAWAYDFEVDGICYNITSNTAPYTVEVTTKLEGSHNLYSGDVVIPESVSYNGTSYSVTKIGMNAFLACDELISVTIPNSVIKISSLYNTFLSQNLVSINIDPNNPRYKSQEGVLFNHNMDTLLLYPHGKQGEYSIPNSVVCFFPDSFRNCSGLTSLNIGISIDTIPGGAFNNCSSLSTISIPNSVKYIGSQSFRLCTSLLSITIPDSVTEIGWNVFDGCSSLTSVSLSCSLTTIAEGMFYDCESLSYVYIPNSITKIESRAFFNCSSLSSVSIPNTVTSIGSYAFSMCTGLTSITLPDLLSAIEYGMFYGCSELSSITIPNFVTTIEGEAFCNCTGLSSVTIPNLVNTISGDAFVDCRGLLAINVEPENERYKSIDGVVFTHEADTIIIYPCGKHGEYVIPNTVKVIGENSFNGCKGLTSISIPNSVTTIGAQAYEACTGLTSVNISNSVTTINWHAFYNCKSLSSFTIPSSVTIVESHILDSTAWHNNQPNGVLYLDNWCLGYKGNKPTGHLSITQGTKGIADYAFSNCTELTSVFIPNSVKTLSGFYGCTGLGSITIPNSVATISDYTFSRCGNITSVISLSSTPPLLGKNAFNTNINNLIVCCGCMDAYEASDWATYFDTIYEDCNNYSIAVVNNNQNGGNVSVSQTTARLGTEISITTSTNNDYVLYSLTVCNAANESETVLVENGKFIMPNFNVFVKSHFSHTGIDEGNNIVTTLYPNPTSGIVTIEAENMKHIRVFNLLGQKIMENTASGNSFECDMSRFGAGVYMMQIETEKGVAAKRVVVE